MQGDPQIKLAATGTNDIYQAVIDHISENVVVIGRDHTVISCNSIAVRTLKPIHKKDLKVGDDYRGFVAEENYQLYLDAFAKAVSGETINVEKEIKIEDRTVWYQLRMNPVVDAKNNVLAVTFTAINIDQRKRKEIALEQSQLELEAKTKQLEISEKYFRTLIETSSDAIVLMDATGKVFYQTPSTEKISGYSLEEIQNIDGIELIHPDDRQEDNNMFRELVSSPGIVLRRRHRLKRKDGRYIWIEGTYQNLLDEESVHAIVYNYRDITEKVRANEALAKYNREVTLLNKINDIILHATDEQDLYNEVCKCIIVSGGYKLAWLCLQPEKDESRIVRPIVAYGVTEYLKDFKVSLSDPELSKGPTATVLLTGEKVITNNVHQSARFKPWLERANKFGISASIVVPLRISDAVYGALNVYSGEMNAFADHEVSILERLADNLSLAVHNIRTEKEKERSKYLFRERVKELTTIYNVNSALQNEQATVDEVFTKIVNILPPGWQYPEVCEAKISFEGQDFCTPGYKETTFSQSRDFSLMDGRKGTVEVIYTEDMPGEYEGPFLKEERDLIDAVAETVKVYFNKASQQRELAKSEANFRSSFEHAAIGIALVSLDGHWLKVNRELCNILGYAAHELALMTFRHVTHPDDIESDVKSVQQLLEGTIQYYRTEKRYLHKNGSVIWGNLNVSLVHDANGAPLYFVSQIENITERKESDLKFRNLVEQSLVGVYILQNNKFAYVNPRIVEESGYSEEELTTMSIEKFVHEDDIEVVRNNIQARIKGEMDEARYEVRAFKKDGRLMWLEMFGSVTLYKGAPAVIGTMVNITEKKAVYNELVKSEANLKSIFDNTEVSYLLLDENFIVVTSNQYFQKGYALQTGYAIKPGTIFFDLVLPDKRDYVRKVLENVKANSEPIEYETCYTNKEIAKYFYVTVSPVVTNGTIIGFCVAGHDITNRKNMEIERQKIVADLVNRNRDLQEFAEVVSHSLRGPLATILGLTNMFKGEITQEEKDFIVDGVGVTAEKLDAVVRELNNILDVKIESAEVMEAVEMEWLVAEVTEKFRDMIKRTGAIFELDFSAVPKVVTMRSYLKNILYNLISNSLKYSNSSRVPHITIWTQGKPGKVLLGVKDNGIGIDMKKYQGQMFLANKRFHNSAHGKGLGLFIVKAQVDILNGTIEIDSQPDVGTTVSIVLPEVVIPES